MATIAGWDFTGDVFTATAEDANVTAGAITDGGLHVAPTFATFSYPDPPAMAVRPSNTSTDAASAVANGSYFHFTVTADSGYELNLTALDFNAAKGGSAGPRGWVLRSDVDSYEADIDTADITTTRSTLSPFSIDLSGASFQGLSAITFRVYIYAPGTGSTVEMDDFVLSGTVDATGGGGGATPKGVFGSRVLGGPFHGPLS